LRANVERRVCSHGELGRHGHRVGIHHRDPQQCARSHRRRPGSSGGGDPVPIAGLDFDNGIEFINHDLVAWAGEREIFFTRSRPYRKSDQATIESKNNHLVRRYGFHWRHDTVEASTLLSRLWPVVNDRFNYFTPTKKPTGRATTASGRRKRLYAAPRTPLERLLDAGVLSTGQADQLTGLAKRPTLDLVAATTKPLPDAMTISR